MSFVMKKMGSGAVVFEATFYRSESRSCVVTGEKCDREMVTEVCGSQSRVDHRNKKSYTITKSINL